MRQLGRWAHVSIGSDQFLHDDYSVAISRTAWNQRLAPVARIRMLLVAWARLYQNRRGRHALWQELMTVFQRRRRMFW